MKQHHQDFFENTEALQAKTIKTSTTIEALQVKITYHLHKTFSATEEEDKKDIITIYNPGQRSSLKPIYHGQRSTERSSEKAYTKLTKDSIMKLLSSEKPDDLTRTWRHRRDKRVIHMR